MFGLGSSKSESHSDDNSAIIFDVGAQDFEARVIAASMEKPVIVDFWAPWCGPCKQLMPTLEKVVMAAGGDVLLAKVNLDENPELAQALRVQSVPMVFAFLGGRPVDMFQGNVPESQIQAFVDKLIQAARASQPGALNIEEALAGAADALAAGDLQGAQGIYGQILQQDEKNVPAYVGLVKTFIAADMVEQAQGLVNSLPEDIQNDPAFAEAKTALELAANKPDDSALNALKEAALKDENDHSAQIGYAEGLFAAGAREEAIDILIASIKRDREWNEQAARKALLQFFEAMGFADPLSVEGRKKLSSILFS